MPNDAKHNHPFIDKIIYPFALISPLIALPQVYDIWVLHKVEGVSLLSWGGFGLMSFIWLWHALVHKDKPLVFNICLSFIFNILIIAGVLFFAQK